MKKAIIVAIFALSVLGLSSALFAVDCDDFPSVNQQLQLHIPFARLANGTNVWADFDFVPTDDDLLVFRLARFGQRAGEFGCDAEDMVTVNDNLKIVIPHLLIPNQGNPDGILWVYLAPVSDLDFVPNPDNDFMVKVLNYSAKEIWDSWHCQYRGEIELIYFTYEPLIDANTRLPFCVAPSGVVTIGGGTMPYDAKTIIDDAIFLRKGVITVNPTGQLGNVPGGDGQVETGLVVDLHGSVNEHTELKLLNGQVLLSEDVASEWEDVIVTFPFVRDWAFSTSRGVIASYPISPGGLPVVPLTDYVMGILRLNE